MRCYLHAIDLLLSHSLTPEVARSWLDRVDLLAREHTTPVLAFELALLHARYAFAVLDDREAQTLLVRARDLLAGIAGEPERGLLWRKLGLQHATLAMVWEDWQAARQTLDEALEACPKTMPAERVDLLQSLLQLSTEIGDWSTADDAYLDAREILPALNNSVAAGLLSMHYGASLARRGDLEAAHTRFSEAIQLLDGHPDLYKLWQAHETMLFMLTRHGALWFDRMDEYDRRRIDLFHLTASQNQGLTYEEAAIKDLGDQSYRGAFRHLRLALMHYRRDGQWSGVERVYALMARLWAATSEPVEALVAAIRAADKRATDQHATALRNTGAREQLEEVVEILVVPHAIVSEQRFAVLALGILADVVPPDSLDRALQRLEAVLQDPEDTRQQAEMRRYAAEALRSFAPQFTAKLAGRIVRLALQQIDRTPTSEVVEELLKLIDACVLQSYVDPSLHSELVDTLLKMARNSDARPSVERVAVHLARAALPEIKQRIVSYLHSHPNTVDRLGQLAFLEQSVSTEQLTAEIDRVLRAIRPQPEFVTTNGVTSRSISISGVVPRTLTNFANYLTPTLGNRVVDGLIATCVNEDTELWVRSDALRALAALPASILRDRADDLADPLLTFAEGTLPLSSLIQWGIESQTNAFSNVHMNMGKLEDVRRNALAALGRLYGFVGAEHRQRVAAGLTRAGRDENSLVRQGVAMALEAVEHDQPLDRHVLMRLYTLLSDAMPDPRAWACHAAGHVIARKLAGVFADELFDELLNTIERAREVEVRVGGAVGLRQLVESHWPRASARVRITQALTPLINDVSSRVRTEAAIALRLLGVMPDPDSVRARTRAALATAGLLTELGPDLRRRANPFVVAERVQEAMDRAGNEPLSDLVLAERGPRE